MKWSYLFESDEELRRAERAYKQHGSPDSLLALLKARCRIGAGTICGRKTEPSSASQWTKFAALYGAVLSHQPGSGARYFDLVFPTDDLREFFLEATQHLSWLNYNVLRERDKPGSYSVALHTTRGIRGPRLSRVNYTIERLDWGDELLQGTQYYNLPRAITYRASGRQQRHIIGSGSHDHTELYRFYGDQRVYLLALGSDYVGLTAYEDGEESGEQFLQMDHHIEDVLGPMGLDLPETQIVRRLYNRM